MFPNRVYIDYALYNHAEIEQLTTPDTSYVYCAAFHVATLTREDTAACTGWTYIIDHCQEFAAYCTAVRFRGAHPTSRVRLPCPEEDAAHLVQKGTTSLVTGTNSSDLGVNILFKLYKYDTRLNHVSLHINQNACSQVAKREI